MIRSIVAAVEIGTSRTKVLVGEIFDEGRLNIIGRAEQESKGVVKGRISNFRQAAQVTIGTIEQAEAIAGTEVEEVYLSSSGAHLEAFERRSTVQVSGTENRVTRNDIERVTAEARGKELPPERTYIHFVRNAFLLDGTAVEDPFEMEGRALEVSYWNITGDAELIRNHMRIFNSREIVVSDLIVSSVASACMVATEEEKRTGCLVIDVGAGTTDYALYRNGFITRTGSIPVGGIHLTNDLSIGLQIRSERAEELKREVGCAVSDPAQSGETIRLYGDLSIGDRTVQRSALNRILEVRLDELFTLVRDECGGIGALRASATRAILTGGSSHLAAIDRLAEKVLGISVRLARNPDWVAEELRDPEYSTVLGLMHYALRGHQEHSTSATLPRKLRFIEKVSRLLGG